MLPFLQERFGNAASGHHVFGRDAAEAVEDARSQVAELIGATPQEIAFTSGATESNNLALKGVAEARANRLRHIITSPTEHPSVLDSVERLAERGFEVALVPVDRYGVVDVDALRGAIRPETLMVSIMAANNEIGTIAPLAAISAAAREQGVLFHCDASQLVGKVDIDVKALSIDLLSISGHKMYGPKGIGALYIRRQIRPRVAAILDGGGHERGLRSGTLNVPGCVGLGEAARIASEEMAQEAERLNFLRSCLHEQLAKAIDGLVLNGHPTQRLPGNLNLGIPGVDADALMLAVPEVALSSGSACSSASEEPSHVLLAIGVPYEQALQCIRIGVGRFNSAEDVNFAAEQIIEGVRRLRASR
jgi:cysteine desulfurase